ncbi:hypothetical protein [Prevotella dentasini]|uniref:hypothetical protein n=1 Tax=Prevotella dentasini TaxID=589537 RepID=UPI00046832E2|nr:hypothetical protein [Prevotella dentasini]
MKKNILTFVAACCLSAVVPQSAFALVDPTNPGKVIDWEEGHFRTVKELYKFNFNGIIVTVFEAVTREGTTIRYGVDSNGNVLPNIK